jgi:AcrR family transcriptional regulator
MEESASAARTPKRTVGRPRVLTLAAIVDAASAMASDAFSMTAVAQKLGVSVGTLYTYVESRDDLERLVSIRRMRRSRLIDSGQSWQEVIRTLILNAVSVFASEPRSIVRFMDAIIGVGDGVEGMEDVLGILVSRGFTLEQAVDAHRNAGLVALGLAVARIHRASAAERGVDHGMMISRILEDAGPGAFPTVSAASARIVDETAYFSADSVISQLITGIAAELSQGPPG